MTSFSIVLGVLAVIAISVYIIAGIVSGGTSTHDASELRMTSAVERIKPASRVVETGSTEAQAEAEAHQQAQTAPQVASAAAAMSGADVYNSGCNACHAAGVLNAPKLGDKEAWEPRYEKGLDQLVQHALNGFNQMPAKGGNTALSETNIHDSVVYMLTESGIELPEADKAETAAESPPAEQPAENTAATTTATTAETASTETAPAEAVPTETAAAETAPAATAPAATAPAAAATEQTATEPAVTEPAVTEPAATEQTASTTAGDQQPAAPTETQPDTGGSEDQAAAAAPADSAPAAAATPATSVVPGDVDIETGKQVYDMACFVCHAGAVPNAPKLGDKEAWTPRLAQGWEVLVQHALKGYNAMPAKGGRADLSDEQVTAAIGYMASQAQ
jgi:cytochrome c5